MRRSLTPYQPPRAGLPRRLPAEAMARGRSYQRASKASTTVRAYRTDAAAFDAWCKQHELQAVPAVPATIAVFLVDEAERGARGPSRRRTFPSGCARDGHGGGPTPGT